jgi:hypothetical protein
MAYLQDPRLHRARMASLAARGPLLPGTLAVRCEDGVLCLECTNFYTFAAVSCEATDRCRSRDDLKLIDGVFRCSMHRGDSSPPSVAPR